MDSTNSSRRILIAGATHVGKTWLLAAFERAALQNRRGEPRITFAPIMTPRPDPAEQEPPIPSATSQYLVRAADFFLRGIPFVATEQTQRYDFKLGIQDVDRSAIDEFEFLDAPGRFTTPSDPSNLTQERRRLLDEARSGFALVFCFESLPSIRPREALSVLELNLSTLLGNLTTAAGRINYERILLLLTKIDIATGLLHDRIFGGDPAHPLTPLKLAQDLDPLEQMRSVVGTENIAKFLTPESKCDIGVGICSAIGFDRETGQTMISPYTGVPAVPPGRTAQEHYLRWTPFGVREALLFLARGRSSSSTRVIRPGDVDAYHGPQMARIAYVG